jgi:hypothetical protein
MSASVDKQGYRTFLQDTDAAYCWWCGSHSFERPDNWHSPYLIERAHIVASPRVEDRRVCILCCSMCHKASHGERIAGYKLPAPTLGNMLWLKRTFDPEFYDLAFMRRFSIRSLPSCSIPEPEVRAEFASRHGCYPRGKRQL